MSDEHFRDLGTVIDATDLGIRIGADTVQKTVYVQFYFEEDGKEQRYTLKMRARSFERLAEFWPQIKNEIDLFDQLKGGDDEPVV